MSPKLPTDAMVEAGRLALMDEQEHDRCISLEPAEMRVALTAALAVAPRDEALAKSDDLIPPPTRFLSERDHLDMMHAMRRSGKVVRSAESADDAFNAGLEDAAWYHEQEAERIREICQPLTLKMIDAIGDHDEAATAIRARKRNAK